MCIRDSHGLGHAQCAARNLTLARPRIPRVNVAIDDAIEAHRGESRAREREYDPTDHGPRDLRAIRCENDPDQRERKREQRMGKLYEVGIDEPARSAMRECLTFPLAGSRRTVGRRHRSAPGMPSDAHFALTTCFVASSITMTPGHTRVKPSSGSLRVASRPILD